MSATTTAVLTGGAYTKEETRRRPLWRRYCAHPGVRFPALSDGSNGENGVLLRLRGHPIDASVQEFVLPFASVLARSKPKRNAVRALKERFFEDLRRQVPDVSESAVRAWKAASPSEWAALATRAAETRRKTKHEKAPAAAAVAVAEIDGDTYRMSRNVVDKPGVFVSRAGGAHPLSGRIRRALTPRDVELNMSVDAPVPRPPNRFRRCSWKAVIHDPYVNWLARWHDPLTGAAKYVYLDGAAELKQRHERRKFDKAREYRARRDEVAEVWERDMEVATTGTGRDAEKRFQAATCAALIEEFGIRAGGRKKQSGEGERADTFGAASLLARHIRLLPKTSSTTRDVRLDYVGKDHVPFAMARSVRPSLYRSIARLLRRKHRQDEPVFDAVTAEDVNEYLDAILPGLTCKVIRTSVAGRLLDARLRSATATATATFDDDNMRRRWNKRLLAVGLLEVAWRMNHRRARGTPSTTPNTNETIDAANAHDVERLFDEVWHNSSGRRERALERAKRFAADHGLAPQTSKANYVDPRVVLSFSRRVGISPGSVYTEAQLARFAWALPASQSPPGFVY